MNLANFYTGDKFGLAIDMRAMADQSLHSSGTHIVNSTVSSWKLSGMPKAQVT